MIVLTMIGLLSLPVLVPAAIKCWENADGVRECGERVPPEYAQKGHKTLNKQGMVVDEAERAKTKEEREEAERLALIKREQEAKKAKQAEEDRILLATYSSVGDIRHTVEQKIAAIESAIKLAEKRNMSNHGALEKSNERIQRIKDANNTVNPLLLEDHASLESQIEKTQAFIDDKQAEKVTVEKEYDYKIERFLQLKGQQ
jgi:signal transduction histidine kinase